MNSNRIYSIFKLLLLQTGLFVVFIALNYFILERSATNQVKRTIDTTIARIKHDLRFVNGKWDTSLYNADPETAYPNASSSHPLAIITTDGFVIERSKPIAGFLDSADFSKLMGFSTPQTINTLANEQWRVFSKPLVRDGKTAGVVVISYYNPDTRLLTEIDQKIQDSANHIESQITIKAGSLDVSKLDIRNVHYDVAFEIVDNTNKVVLNNGRSPSYVDRSYVADAARDTTVRTIRDTTTGEPFLVRVEPINDEAGNPLAIVAAGISTSANNAILRQFLLSSGLIYLLLVLPLSLLIARLARRSFISALKIRSQDATSSTPPSEATFDAAASTIKIGTEEIDIPAESNQYLLLQLLFSEPDKWWSAIELLEQLGEKDKDAIRKYYDAAVAINKKVGFKLIEYKDKAFRLHPEAV